MNWYYEINGAQNGPVGEVDLKGMYGRGELSGENLVWRESMADWASFASVFGDGGAPALKPAAVRSGSARMRRGNSNSHLRAEARGALSGNWTIAALVTFLNQLLQQVAVMIPFIGIVMPLFFAGPLIVGYHAYVLGLVRGDPVEVGTLFGGFSSWLKHAGLFMLTMLIIGLTTVVAAIPGGILASSLVSKNPDHFELNPLFLLSVMLMVLPAVVVGTYFWLRYIFVYFIANDHPELGVLEIMKRSGELMKGQMTKFSWLLFSFTGWHILGLFAFGFGLLWSTAYMFVAFAAYYDALLDTDLESDA